MVGRAGQPKGWPGSLLTGSANPVRLTTPRISHFSVVTPKTTKEFGHE
ncbi:ash family protein [Serratia marcescens]|nr:ash family protein [Serratia marcescens]ULH13740.1 ash family protein [Serratia marcescens]